MIDHIDQFLCPSGEDNIQADQQTPRWRIPTSLAESELWSCLDIIVERNCFWVRWPAKSAGQGTLPEAQTLIGTLLARLPSSEPSVPSSYTRRGAICQPSNQALSGVRAYGCQFRLPAIILGLARLVARAPAREGLPNDARRRLRPARRTA